MASYPGLPDNRLIVNGIDLSMKYGLILIDGYELDPPSPKTTTVDIPGANGSIDLTEALNGDVVYDNRTKKFVFKIGNFLFALWLCHEFALAQTLTMASKQALHAI